MDSYTHKSMEIYISDSEAKATEALEVTDSFISKTGLTGRNAIRFRLLAEETIGMVRAMTGDFKALFWLEEEEGLYRVKLMAKTDMSKEKKSSLLSVSSSGKNNSAKGFMGKIGDMIENGMLHFDEVMKLQQEYGVGTVDYGFMGRVLPGEVPSMDDSLVWSLQGYKESLEDASGEQEGAGKSKEAWDELEKSIVANIADDVVVGVKKDRIDMTITWRAS